MTGTENVDNTNEMKNSSSPKAGAALALEEKEESSSQQHHEDLMNDNLGQIAKNIANNFAKNSKRISSGSNNQARNPADQIMLSQNW